MPGRSCTKGAGLAEQGFSLIEPGNLDQAEIELVGSPAFDPCSPVAYHEMLYIAERRKAD